MGKSAQPRSTRAGRMGTGRKFLVGVIAVMMSLLTACTAGTAGGGNTGGGGGGGDANRFINLSPCCSWHPTWSNNRYNVDGLGILDHYVQLALAIRKSPSLTDYETQLAEKWDVADGKVTVHLRDAKWEDGKPVSSADVVNTAYLNGTAGNGMWSTVSSVKAVDEKTIEYTLPKGQDPSLALLQILPMIPYPADQYKSFINDGLKKDVEAYYAKARTDADAAGKMPEFTRMNAVFQKLAAFKVEKVIGNGPFKLDNITSQQAKLSKSTTFYGADKVKIAGINYYNSNNETIYPQLFTGGADFSNVYLPPTNLKKWLDTDGAKVALPQAFGFVMGFNSQRPNLNKKEVRQALAYIIDRKKISEAAYGTSKEAGGVYKEVPTGLSPVADETYLNAEQLGKLNKYEPSTAKATELLQKAGYKKAGDKWNQPDGKPFKLTMTVNSETSDIVTSFTSAAKMLTAFGIETEVRATNGAQQDADQHNGNFDIGMYFVGGSNPLSQYNSMLGPGQNFSNQGNYTGKKGIGFGPKKDVPGVGNVDVATTISNQEKTTPPGDKMKEVAWSWAQVVNDEVPYIWYATKVYQFSFSTTHYDNWPEVGENGSSALWDITGDNMGGGLSLMFQQGYIVPKK